jgi:hypothetical protein
MNFLLFVLEILFIVTAACGELMHGSPTLAYGSYCFTCRPHFALRTAPDTLI